MMRPDVRLAAIAVLLLAAGCRHPETGQVSSDEKGAGVAGSAVSHPPGPGGLPAGAPKGAHGEPLSLDREMAKVKGVH